MLRSGELDRRISIERNLPTQNVDGQLIENWQRLGRPRWSGRSYVDGDERYVSDQFIARQQVVFTVRWARDLAELSPKDRIVYPIKDEPTDSEIYDVIEVQEIGFREGLRIVAARRAETA